MPDHQLGAYRGSKLNEALAVRRRYRFLVKREPPIVQIGNSPAVGIVGDFSAAATERIQ